MRGLRIERLLRMKVATLFAYLGFRPSNSPSVSLARHTWFHLMVNAPMRKREGEVERPSLRVPGILHEVLWFCLAKQGSDRVATCLEGLSSTPLARNI